MRRRWWEVWLIKDIAKYMHFNMGFTTTTRLGEFWNSETWRPPIQLSESSLRNFWIRPTVFLRSGRSFATGKVFCGFLWIFNLSIFVSSAQIAKALGLTSIRHRPGTWGTAASDRCYVDVNPGVFKLLHVNSLRAKFFRGNINIYLHLISLLHIDMTQVQKSFFK